MSKGRRDAFLRCNRRVYKHTGVHFWQIFNRVPHEHQYPPKDMLWRLAKLAEILQDADLIVTLLQETIRARSQSRGRRGIKRTGALLRDDLKSALEKMMKQGNGNPIPGTHLLPCTICAAINLIAVRTKAQASRNRSYLKQPEA